MNTLSGWSYRVLQHTASGTREDYILSWVGSGVTAVFEPFEEPNAPDLVFRLCFVVSDSLGFKLALRKGVQIPGQID